MSHGTAWWVTATVRATVHTRSDLTFYVKHGDYIGKGAYGMSVLLLLLAGGLAMSGRKF